MGDTNGCVSFSTFAQMPFWDTPLTPTAPLDVRYAKCGKAADG